MTARLIESGIGAFEIKMLDFQRFGIAL